jgi:hypothetical protein
MAKGRQAQGGNHGNAKFTDAQAAEILTLHSKGIATPTIARRVGSDYRSVWRVVTGRCHKYAHQKFAEAA